MYRAICCTLTNQTGVRMLNQNATNTSVFSIRAAIVAAIFMGAVAVMSSQPAEANKTPGAYPTEAEGFAFLDGNWRVSNRKMKEPGSGREEWTEFQTKAKFFTLLDGLVSVEELRNDKGEPFGSAMRTFDREQRTWSDAWVSARTGVLQLPSHGRFVDGVGTWTASEVIDGKTFLARGVWRRISKNEVTWEALDSLDGGKTWVLNWKMRFERVDENGKVIK
jgi:hypothetical protein